MKNFKKLLIALCVLAVAVSVFAVCSLAETVDPEYTGNVRTATVLVENYYEADDKGDAILALHNYLLTVDPEADGYEELMASAQRADADYAARLYAYATEDYSSFGAYANIRQNEAVRTLLAFVEAYPLDEVLDADLIAQIAAARGAYEARLAEDLAALNQLVAAYDSASDKAKAISAIHEKLPTVDPVAEGYEETLAEIGAIEASYAGILYSAAVADYSSQGAYEHIYQNAAARELLSFAMECTFDEESYPELVAQIAAVREAYEARLAADREALYSLAPITVYSDYPTAQYTVDFENETVGTAYPSSMTSHLSNKSSMPNGGNSHFYGVMEEENGNRYWAIIYNYYSDVAVHNYIEWNWNKDTPVVLEWDYSTENSFPTNHNPQSALNHNGGRAFPEWFNLSKGLFSSGNKTYTISDPIIQKHQWTHFTCVINTTGELTVYIDYVKVGSWSADSSNRKYLETDYLINVLRMGQTQTGAGQSFAIDNFTAYNGLYPRDVNFLTNLMADRAAALKYFAAIAVDEDVDFNDRYLAIEKSSGLIKDFYDFEAQDFYEDVTDEELKDAVRAILAIDTAAIEAEVKAQNYQTFLQLLNQLAALSANGTRTLGNVADRTSALASLEDFKAANLLDLAQVNAHTATVAAYGAMIEQDNAARLFISEMNVFNRHFTYASMVKHFAEGDKYYAQLDPTVVYAIASEQASFAEALTIYDGARDILDAATRENNSARIVTSVRKISVFAEDEWDENYAFINGYVTAIRKIIKSGEYDLSYAGLAEAIATFNEINDYFFSKLQQQHIDVISERIEIFQNSTAYIERLGAVAYIERYLANNEIDENNATLNGLIVQYETLKDELDIQEGEYTVLLNQNTERFMNVITVMRAYSDYESLRRYFDRATDYYFTMNAAGEGLEEAISFYNEVADRLKVVETASARFVENAAALEEAETKDDIYRALVACYKDLADADPSFEGVPAALVVYLDAYNAYNAQTLPQNGEIVVAADAMCAVRSLCNLKGIMSLIRSLIY